MIGTEVAEKRKLRVSYNAPVVLGFVGFCLLATIAGSLTGGWATETLFSASKGSLANPLTYLRCLTHVLGHTGFDHFAGNAMFLLLLGPMLEEKYGSGSVLKIILATAAVTGAVHCVVRGNSSLCGASGVVFAFIVLSSFTAFKEGEIPLSFILVVAVFLGMEICEGIFVNDSVSNLTHVLGGAVGGGAGYLLNRKAPFDRGVSG